MTQRALICSQSSEPRQTPSHCDAHEALIALVRLLARAEARRWLVDRALNPEQDHGHDLRTELSRD